MQSDFLSMDLPTFFGAFVKTHPLDFLSQFSMHLSKLKPMTLVAMHLLDGKHYWKVCSGVVGL